MAYAEKYTGIVTKEDLSNDLPEDIKIVSENKFCINSAGDTITNITVLVDIKQIHTLSKNIRDNGCYAAFVKNCFTKNNNGVIIFQNKVFEGKTYDYKTWDDANKYAKTKGIYPCFEYQFHIIYEKENIELTKKITAPGNKKPISTEQRQINTQKAIDLAQSISNLTLSKSL